jgi:uncharacterized LabA/DUF88 family protein
MNQIYAFIDSQNLNLGISKDVFNKDGKKVYAGYKLDFLKFRKYLTDKYKVTKAYLFIGMVPGNETLYKYLQESGYILVFKPTLKVDNKKSETVVKGNVDAELVLYSSAIEFANYSKSVIVSGDGDFHCLYQFLLEKNKLEKILIPNKYRYSSLLRKYSEYLDFVSQKKEKLKVKKTSITCKTGLTR